MKRDAEIFRRLDARLHDGGLGVSRGVWQNDTLLYWVVVVQGRDTMSSLPRAAVSFRSSV